MHMVYTAHTKHIDANERCPIRDCAEQPGAESQLLAVACSQLDPMLSSDLKLFEANPSLQRVYSQAHR